MQGGGPPGTEFDTSALKGLKERDLLAYSEREWRLSTVKF